MWHRRSRHQVCWSLASTALIRRLVSSASLWRDSPLFHEAELEAREKVKRKMYLIIYSTNASNRHRFAGFNEAADLFLELKNASVASVQPRDRVHLKARPQQDCGLGQ